MASDFHDMSFSKSFELSSNFLVFYLEFPSRDFTFTPPKKLQIRYGRRPREYIN